MIERKTVKFALKQLTEDGTFEGYAAVYGVEDLGGDVIDPGCFKRSITNKGGKFPLLSAHDTTKEIGLAQVEEDGHGIRVIQGKLYINPDPQGKEILEARNAYIRMKARQEAEMPMGMSIGYETLKSSYTGPVRHLKEAKLWEISTDVTFPMQPLAGTTDVKAVVPFQDLPLAARDRAWDSSAAEGRIRTWAGADNGLDTAAIQRKYRQAFAWYDAESADTYGAYKLQIADILSDTLTAVPRAIFSVAGVLQGARGGVQVPDSELPRLKTHIARYYAKMRTEWSDDNVIAPWLQENAMPPTTVERKNGDDGAQTFTEILVQRDLWEQRYQIDMAFWQSVGSIVEDDDLLPDQKLAMISTSLAQFTTALMDWARAYVAIEAQESQGAMRASAHLATKTVSYLYEAFTATAAERKAGAVLNAQNRATILDCITQLQALLDAATGTAETSAMRHVAVPVASSALATKDHPASGDSHAADDTDPDYAALFAQLHMALTPV